MNIFKILIGVLKKIVLQENGQGMVEYVVILMGMLASFILINALILPGLNRFYHLVSTMGSLPFP